MSLIWVPGSFLPDAAALVYKVPAGKVVTRLSAWLTNASASARTFTMHIVPDGDSVDDSNKVLDLSNEALKIPANEEQPIELRQVLRPGDEIHWYTDAVDSLAGTLSLQLVDESEDHPLQGVIEIPRIAGTNPVTVKVQRRFYSRSDIGFVPANPGFDVIHVVPAGRVVVGMTLLLHNTDTVGRPEGVFAIPAGGSDSLRYLIGTHQGVIPAGATRERQYDLSLSAGTQIRVTTTAPDKLVQSLSVEEIQI